MVPNIAVDQRSAGEVLPVLKVRFKGLWVGLLFGPGRLHPVLHGAVALVCR